MRVTIIGADYRPVQGIGWEFGVSGPDVPERPPVLVLAALTLIAAAAAFGDQAGYNRAVLSGGHVPQPAAPQPAGPGAVRHADPERRRRDYVTWIVLGVACIGGVLAFAIG